MNNGKEKMYLRFTKKQIFIHWLFAGSFFVLALTGLIMVIPGLSFLAAGGLSGIIHRAAAVMFILAPIIYFLVERQRFKELIKDSFTYDKDDIDWILKVFDYFLGKTRAMPPSGRINGGEKLHHGAIIVAFVTITISGLFLWFGSAIMNTTIFLVMIWLHNISMFIMLCLTVGHIYFTFVYDALPHMLSGYTTESYAKKHIKWLRKLQRNETNQSI
ncbi:formate dehydrogenase subunit gamma [Desulfitibacter alkalitolerans]|uniref:formate dehydrogenase subunit gamma n=1 Tax=Desulfitibacter alkalitolerans TaxID=264641 RepID=UPI0004851562|nr:cytochrome b/b6 domain-containing protein [Desulfitibacter alkalitolerans]